MESNILKDIPDGKPVRIFLPLTSGNERYRVHCLYQKTTPPKFNLLFKPGILPEEFLDTSRMSIISVDMGGPNISLEANIIDVVNSQQLEMAAIKLINHEQMREFFRVDTTTKVISESFHPTVIGKPKEKWSFSGETIDISGSGLLATFSEPPPMDKRVTLTLTLPSEEKEQLTVLARPIRFEEVGSNQYDVAYHFEDISTEDRDKIIGCCLNIQRRLLRMKVQVKK